jgi:hypothetical protein
MKNVTPEILRKRKFRTEVIATLVAVGLLLALVLAVVWPLLTIWALNALFKLSINYTFANWFACAVLILTLQAALGISKKTVQISKKDQE